METDIKRFNVYTIISDPNTSKPQIFLLESWDGYNWEDITSNENSLDFDSLDKVAQRIVELAPPENMYKRVIFKNEPQNEYDGNLEGIMLNNGSPYLVDSLSREERVTLLSKMHEYYKKLDKNLH